MAVTALDALEEFRGVVADAVLEHDLYFFDVVDVDGGVAVDDDQVGVFALCDASDGCLLAFVGRAVKGGDLDGFDGGEAAGVDEKFDFTLVAEAGERTAIAGRIQAGNQEAASGYELVFERCSVVEGFFARGILRTAELKVASVEVGFAGRRRHGLEDARLQVKVRGDAALEDGQGAGDRDVMVDQEFDERGGVLAVGIHVGEGRIAGSAGADVELLTGIILGVDEEAVLEVVDACFDGFRVGNGAEVASNFEVVRVCGIDRGFEFGAGDVHVGLVAGGAFGRPVVDEDAGVVGTSEVVHLDEGAVGAFEVRGGNIDVWADEFAGVDVATEVEVNVWLDAAGGANGGDACGEIHARCAEGHLGDDEGRLGSAVGGFVGAGDVVEVIVHTNEAGDNGVAVEVNYRDVGCGGGLFGDAGDLSVFNEDGLVFEGRGTGAVDDADVSEED